MRLVLLSSDDPVAHLVYRRLSEEFDVSWFVESTSILERILIPVTRKKHKLRARIGRVATLLVFGFYYKLSISPALVKHFSLGSTANHSISIKKINSLEALSLVTSQKPDLLITLGTSMLKGRWLEQDIRMLNMHTGHLPWYRGRFCWFWPLIKSGPVDIGVSLHHIQKTSDSGDVIRFSQVSLPKQKQPAVRKLFIALAQCHLDVLQDINNIVKELTQSSESHNQYEVFFEPNIFELMRGLKILRSLH